MDLKFYGGVSEVGSLGMSMTHKDKRLLFDYGITPTNPPGYPEPTEHIDWMFLSHAHVDHSGMIPWVTSRYNSPVFATPPTMSVAQVLIEDSLKICDLQGYACPFTKGAVKSLRSNYQPITYDTVTELDGLTVDYTPSGHIPGGTIFTVTDEEGQRTVFTGDMNTLDTELLIGTKPIPCDNLIIEATYAGRIHEDRNTIVAQLRAKIEEVVNRGGTVIIPAFAVGRTQEVLLALEGLDYEIWLDGMGKRISRLYMDYPDYVRDWKKLKSAFYKARFVKSPQGRKKAVKGEVIITTSGMLDGGPVQTYLKYLKDDPINAILLTGYQVENTNGRRLLEEGVIKMDGEVVPVRAEVGFYDLSAHADHNELIKYIRGCSPKNVILFHSDNRQAIVDELGSEVNVLAPKTGEIITI